MTSDMVRLWGISVSILSSFKLMIPNLTKTGESLKIKRKTNIKLAILALNIFKNCNPTSQKLFPKALYKVQFR